MKSILPDPKIIEQTLCDLATHIKEMHRELHEAIRDMHEESEAQTEVLREILEELKHQNLN